ncbi:hypothetical protein [Phosphitispora sp. TUW77]
MNNKLNEMKISDLSDQEIKSLEKFEKDMNQMHNGSEVYVIALEK